VPVPGTADGDDKTEKTGAGRPKSSGKKGDGDDDSLSYLLKAAIDMGADLRASKAGDHWLTIKERSAEIARLGSKVFEKYFPTSKLTKYSDEARLIILISQTVGTPLLIDYMNAQAKASEEVTANADGRTSTPPIRLDERAAERSQSPAGRHVRASGPATV
jgi:hypothetical protein